MPDTNVIVLIEDERSERSAEEASTSAIVHHLALHGVVALVRHAAGGNGAAQALMIEIDAVGADLAVLGGYGHSRLRELVLGGMTRKILSDAKIPVLMAH